MTAPTPGNESPIRAAGCLVYRQGGRGLEVLVIHRPRYDDWDLPKGKAEPDEDDLACARREVEEETGYVGEIGPELPTDHYVVRGRDKYVRWWLMRATGGEFTPNDEVDEIRWLPPDEARRLLSHQHPRHLLGSLDSIPTAD